MDNQTPVVPPPEFYEMAKYIFELLRTQGVNFLLLGVAVWYLQEQNMELRREVMKCQGTQIDYLTSKNEALTKTVEANTAALAQISEVLRKKR